jgi:L-seryl-tRNA(Ser) seleniumtransferase
MSGTQTSGFSQLPSIDHLLNSDAAMGILHEFGRDEVKRAARQTLSNLRDAINRRESIATGSTAICQHKRRVIEDDRSRGIRRVFNLSGTILHTNLGRALLPEESINAVVEVLRTASSLEFDLGSGSRGERNGYLEDLLCRLTGAEAATVVNNNAAALMLLLNTLALDRELPISLVGRIHKGEFVLDCRCLEDDAEFCAQLDKLEIGA